MLLVGLIHHANIEVHRILHTNVYTDFVLQARFPVVQKHCFCIYHSLYLCQINFKDLSLFIYLAGVLKVSLKVMYYLPFSLKQRAAFIYLFGTFYIRTCNFSLFASFSSQFDCGMQIVRDMRLSVCIIYFSMK